MNMEKMDVLERAMVIAKERRADRSPQLLAAFANSVQTLVTGWSGGYGGPSVREHVACRLRTGEHTFEQAVELLIREDGPIFGPLTDLHRYCWKEEHCFDDDPSDVEQLS